MGDDCLTKGSFAFGDSSVEQALDAEAVSDSGGGTSGTRILCCVMDHCCPGCKVVLVCCITLKPGLAASTFSICLFTRFHFLTLVDIPPEIISGWPETGVEGVEVDPLGP